VICAFLKDLFFKLINEHPSLQKEHLFVLKAVKALVTSNISYSSEGSKDNPCPPCMAIWNDT